MKYLNFYTIIVFLISVSCNSQTSKNKIENTYISARSFFPKKTLRYMPENSNSNTIIVSTNVNSVITKGDLKNEFSPIFLFAVENYKKNQFDSLKMEIKKNSLINIESNDTNIILIGSYLEMKESDYFQFIGFDSGEESFNVINRNIRMYEKTPIPIFDINGYKDSTYSHLDRNFTFYVTDFQKGIFIDDKYLSKKNLLPENWKHGYSNGCAIEEKEQIIIYWVVVW